MTGRTVAWIGGTAVLATWFVAAAGQGTARRPEPPPALAPAPSETERAASAIQAQAELLRERLHAAPVPSGAGRNPFLFVRRTPPPVRHVAPPPAGNPALEFDEPLPFTLSGIATDEGPDGLVRTAVLSGFGDVYLAKAGETIASRYDVLAVGADAVELRDRTDGRVIRLGLP